MTEPVVLVATDPSGVATVTLNRPEVGNAYNAAMLETIAREIAPALGWSPKNLPDPVR